MADPDVIPPRPQLVRSDWVDLCGEWQFAYDDRDEGLRGRWHAKTDVFDRTITVPFPPESRLSGIGERGFHPVVWYRLQTAAPAYAVGSRLLMHFGAVDYHARVWVNGAYVGEHRGGHTPFSFDVTELVAPDEPLVVVVRAEDQPEDRRQPRGKQDWRLEPRGIRYERTTGIWQPVWLESVGSAHVIAVHWLSDPSTEQVSCRVRLDRRPVEPLTLDIQVSLRGREVARHSVTLGDELTTVDLTVPSLRKPEDRALVSWSPETPTLFDARLVLSDGAAVVDEVRSYFGVRSVECSERRFLLNGEPRFVRAVLAQGYWPESHLATPDAAALRREVELIKALGFDTVRVHQKVEDPRFLYWCDRLGVMVWGEMANAYAFDATAVERLTSEWLEVLDRDLSHPCIVTWVPVNESWGVDEIATDAAQRDFVLALYRLTKALDPSRPVVANDGWEQPEGDIWGIHDYARQGRRLQQRYGTRADVDRVLGDEVVVGRRVVLPGAVDRGQPVMLTEFGGVHLDASGAEEGWGYVRAKSPEALLKRVRGQVRALLGSPDLAGFCYTQLTDTGQEKNGLLTEDREPKLPLDELRRVFSAPAAAEQPDQSDRPDQAAPPRRRGSRLLGAAAGRRTQSSTMDQAP